MCISEHGDLEQAETAFKAGGRGFLVAPYDPVVMEAKLLDLLQAAELAASSAAVAEKDS